MYDCFDFVPAVDLSYRHQQANQEADSYTACDQTKSINNARKNVGEKFRKRRGH